LVRGATLLFLLEISFSPTPSAKGIGGFQARRRRRLAVIVSKARGRTEHLGQQIRRFMLFLAEPSRSTHRVLVRWL
jgi:hypothetical protein